MSTEVGALHYDLNIDDKKLKGQLDNADKSVKGFGDRVNKYWGDSVAASQKFMLGITAAAGAAVAFGVKSVQAFQESQNVMAQTNAVLKSTGNAAGVTAEQVSKLASKFQGLTKFTDEQIQSGQNILLTFTKISKDIFPQATEVMLDMSQALGQDLKSSSIQLGKALQDPILGVTALRRVGVNFSEAQQDVIKNLVATGRAGEAQAMILKELQTEFGGSAKAAGETFAGKLAILKNTFGDLQEAVGGMIANALMPLVSVFNDWMQHVTEAGGLMEYFKGVFDRNRETFILVAGAITGILIPALVAMTIKTLIFLATISPWAAIGVGAVLLFQELGIGMDDVKKFGGGLIERFKGLGITMQGIKDLGAAVVEKLKELWTWFNNLSPVVQLLISPLGFLIASFDVVKNLAMSLADIFMTWFWPSIQAVAATLMDNLWPALQQIWEAVTRLWNALNPALLTALKIIGAIIGVVVVGAIWLFINALNIVINVLSFVISVVSNLINWLANLIGWFGNVAGGAIHAVGIIIGWFGRLPGNIGNIIGQIVDWFRSLPGKIGGVIGGVTDAVSAPFKAAFNAIARFWNSTAGKLSFTAPDWVPGIGGKGFKMPQLPILDTGGIVTQPTVAMLAANSRPEAIIPLDKLAGLGGMTVNIGTIEDRQDADYILNRMDRNFSLVNRGGSPI